VEEQIPLNDESASHFAQRGKNAEAFLICGFFEKLFEKFYGTDYPIKTFKRIRKSKRLMH
jgi:hypothetical protein